MRAQIPKNIRKYEDKVILGMNRRQSLFLLIAALIGIGLYLALRTVLSISFLLPLISMLVGPIILAGSIKISDLYLEEIFYRIYRDMRYNDGLRLYKIENWGPDDDIQ